MLLTASHSKRLVADAKQCGAALMLALLVLFVLLMIVFQITMSSSTDARVAKNDLQLTIFDAAIESAFLKAMDDLAADGPDPEGAAGPSVPTAGPGGFGDAASGEDEESGPVDSRRDDWARPQQTEINGVSLRVLIQDEDSKYNVLTMLVEDLDEAEQAMNRVVRILDLCREGTMVDISEGEARDLAEGMLEFMKQRSETVIPRPKLLTDREDALDYGLPLSLREFVVLPGFNEFMFRDFRDSEGVVVHSIGTFLTVSTSLSTYAAYRSAIEEEVGAGVPDADQAAPGQPESTTTQGNQSNQGPGFDSMNQGGGNNTAGTNAPSLAPPGESNGEPGVAVNINTAPNAVLHGLADRSDVSWSFLDDVLRYRNLEDEEETDPDADPVYDEFGEEVVINQIFDDVGELAEVDGWDLIEPDAKEDFQRFLTVESHVFSIFITARASSSGEDAGGFGVSRAEADELADQGTDRVRTVRAVVWRYADGDEIKIVPLEIWEVLEYSPYEVLDYPEEDR